MMTYTQSSWVPTRKVTAATCGAALAQIAVILFDLPLEIEAPLTIAATALCGWLVREKWAPASYIHTR